MSPRTKPRPVVQSFMCTRCQLRQNVSQGLLSHQRQTRSASSFARSASAPGYFPPLSTPSKPAYAHLSNRSVIRLQGPDVLDFLNGLLPARLHPLPSSNSAPIFTAFLSAKGRILYEAFIYPPSKSISDGSWYIDVDTASQAALFTHLKKHKLRSKFKLEKVPAEQLAVFYIWPGQESTSIEVSELGGQDPRPLMGTRFISGKEKPSRILSAIEENGSCLSLEDYNIHRIISGHAEGPGEIIANAALPQESNIDFDNGIDFHKGCYLGQELTIRTHHTGVVRKRILPCQIYPVDEKLPQDQSIAEYNTSVKVHQPLAEANISKKNAKGRSGRSTGKWLNGVGNIGLALCRLEMMTDIQLTAEGSTFDPEGEFTIMWEEDTANSGEKTTLREVKVKPFVPQWLQDSIKAAIKVRSERGKRKRQEEDEDEDVD